MHNTLSEGQALARIFTSLGGAWEFFEKGGVISYILLGFSVVGLAIFLERWWTLRRASREGEAWLAPVLASVSQGDLARAGESVAGVDHPSARVIGPLIAKLSSTGRFSRDSLESLAGLYGQQEVRDMEKRLPALSTIGNVAPLLGLMGTVIGMVKAFMQIEALEGKVNAAVLAGGIWEALLTTLFGLAVAIPALIAHNYLAARVQRIAAEVSDHAVELVEAAEQMSRAREDASDGLSKSAGTRASGGSP